MLKCLEQVIVPLCRGIGARTVLLSIQNVLTTFRRRYLPYALHICIELLCPNSRDRGRVCRQRPTSREACKFVLWPNGTYVVYFSFVTGLEERVKALERTIQEVHLFPLLSYYIGVILAQLRKGSSFVQESESDDPALQEELPAEGVMMLGSETLPRPVFEKTSSASPPSQGFDSVDVDELADDLKQLHILPAARFFGKSSGFALLNIAMRVKEEHTALAHDNKPNTYRAADTFANIPASHFSL